MKELRENMEKKSKEWKTYQRRRSKQGKSSPDWIVPIVKLAVIHNISETVSPYSYENTKHAIGYRYLEKETEQAVNWGWAVQQKSEGRVQRAELRLELTKRSFEQAQREAAEVA
jgi:hypothetical protein